MKLAAASFFVAASVAGASDTIELDGVAFCQRWYQVGGPRGCSGPKEGATGALFSSEGAGDDADTLIAQIGTNPAILLLKPEQVGVMSNMDATSFLKDITSSAADVVGVISLDDGNLPDVWSGLEATIQGVGTPWDEMNSVDGSNEWLQDSPGNGLIMDDVELPIVAISDEATQLDALRRAATNLNTDTEDLEMATIEAYFGASDVSTTTCLSWVDADGNAAPQCTPIGGQSVKTHMGPYRGEDSAMVFGMAQLDVQGLMESASYGHGSVASHLAPYFAAVDALSKIDLAALPTQIGFMTWQGEAWGFLGSHRSIWDMGRGCEVPVAAEDSPFGRPMCSDPLMDNVMFMQHDFEQSVAFIGIDQVGATVDGQLFTHQRDELDDSAASYAARAPIMDLDNVLAVNPSSVEGLPSSGGVNEYKTIFPAVSTVCLAGYDSEYSTNPYYGSRFDTLDNVDLDTATMADAGTVFVRSLLIAAGASDEVISDAVVDAALVEELFDCLTVNQGCELMMPYLDQQVANARDYLNDDTIQIELPTPPTYYAGNYAKRQPMVWREDGSVVALIEEEDAPFSQETDKYAVAPNALEAFTRGWMADKAASADTDRFGACEVSSECDMAAGQECMLGTCVATYAYFHNAFSAGIRATKKPGVFEAVDLDAPMAVEAVFDSEDLKVTFFSSASSPSSAAASPAASKTETETETETETVVEPLVAEPLVVVDAEAVETETEFSAAQLLVVAMSAVGMVVAAVAHRDSRRNGGAGTGSAVWV